MTERITASELSLILAEALACDIPEDWEGWAVKDGDNRARLLVEEIIRLRGLIHKEWADLNLDLDAAGAISDEFRTEALAIDEEQK